MFQKSSLEEKKGTDKKRRKGSEGKERKTGENGSSSC